MPIGAGTQRSASIDGAAACRCPAELWPAGPEARWGDGAGVDVVTTAACIALGGVPAAEGPARGEAIEPAAGEDWRPRRRDMIPLVELIGDVARMVRLVDVGEITHDEFLTRRDVLLRLL